MNPNVSKLTVHLANLKNTLEGLLLPLGLLKDRLSQLDASGLDLLDDNSTLSLDYLRSVRTNLLNGLKGLLPLNLLLPNLSLLLHSLEGLDTDDPGALLLGLLGLLPGLSNELSLLDDAKLLDLNNTELVALNGLLADLNAALANDLDLLESVFAGAGFSLRAPAAMAGA